MYIIFLAFWILLNGKFNTEILIFGIIISTAVFWFICKYMRYNLHKELLLWKSIGILLVFVLVLIKEIAKANWNVIKLVLSLKYVPEPEVVFFTPDIKSGFAKVLLANAITLTPGTITVSVVGDDYCVHCLDKDYAQGIENSEFITLLQKMEAGWK